MKFYFLRGGRRGEGCSIRNDLALPQEKKPQHTLPDPVPRGFASEILIYSFAGLLQTFAMARRARQSTGREQHYNGYDDQDYYSVS